MTRAASVSAHDRPLSVPVARAAWMALGAALPCACTAVSASAQKNTQTWLRTYSTVGQISHAHCNDGRARSFKLAHVSIWRSSPNWLLMPLQKAALPAVKARTHAGTLSTQRHIQGTVERYNALCCWPRQCSPSTAQPPSYVPHAKCDATTARPTSQQGGRTKRRCKQQLSCMLERFQALFPAAGYARGHAAVDWLRDQASTTPDPHLAEHRAEGRQP